MSYSQARKQYQIMDDKRCPYCKEEMVCVASFPKKRFPGKAMTRDHILPKCRYNDDFFILMSIDQTIRNIIWICNSCNRDRGNPEYNHCVVAMILDRLVKGDDRFYRK